MVSPTPTPQEQVAFVNDLMTADGSYRRFTPGTAGVLFTYMRKCTPAMTPRCHDSRRADTLLVLSHIGFHADGVHWRGCLDRPIAFDSEAGYYTWQGWSRGLGGLNGPVHFAADTYSLPCAVVIWAYQYAHEFVMRWEGKDTNARREDDATYNALKKIFTTGPWAI